MKVLNGWTDHPFYKLIAPLVPAAIIAGLLFWNSTGQNISDIKIKLNSICVDMDDFKKTAEKLTLSMNDAIASREITNYRLGAIEKRLEKKESR